MTSYWCPSCDGDLNFVGSVGVTVHEAGDYQADRYDCNSGHTILVINKIEGDDDDEEVDA